MQERYAKAFADRIAEFATADLPAPTARSIRLLELPGKIDAVIGMRRVGKSWLLLHRVHELLQQGIGRDRILYCEFEDERLAGIPAEHLGLLEEAFFARYPESRNRECWFLFDEIQEVPGWEKFVRRMQADRKRHIAITGSSARLLGNEIASSLRGRAITTELFPFSFPEVLSHRGIEVPDRWPVAGTERSRLQRAFANYMERGGFPEVQDFAPLAWRRTLQGYQETVVLRDVAERHAITNLPALRFVVRRLLRSIGSKTSAHALLQDLRSANISMAKDAIYSLLGHLEDAFLIHLLPLDSTSERRRQMNPRKVYAVDHGLVRACIPTATRDFGHHLENVVYLALRRRGTVVGYHLTEDGQEVDFVFEDLAGERQLVQACADLADPATHRREVAALAKAAAETGITTATIVSEQTAAIERVDGIDVRIVPAWQWLCE